MAGYCIPLVRLDLFLLSKTFQNELVSIHRMKGASPWSTLLLESITTKTGSNWLSGIFPVEFSNPVNILPFYTNMVMYQIVYTVIFVPELPSSDFHDKHFCRFWQIFWLSVLNTYWGVQVLAKIFHPEIIITLKIWRAVILKKKICQIWQICHICLSWKT